MNWVIPRETVEMTAPVATPNKPGRKGVARILAAARYSWSGLKQAWEHEAAFREELLLLLPLLKRIL